MNAKENTVQKTANHYPTIWEALEVLGKLKNRARQAILLEAAFHEAGHAVISVILGGGAFMTEIYWTEKRQKEQQAFGSTGTGCEHGKHNARIVKCAGPIAASELTGYRYKGADYPHVHRICEGADFETAEAWMAAEYNAEKLVLSNMAAIERVAAALIMRAKGKGYVSTSEVREIVALEANGFSASLDFIPAIKDEWRKRAVKQGMKHYKWLHNQAVDIAALADYRGEDHEAYEWRDLMMLQRFGMTVNSDGFEIPRIYL